MIPQAVLHCKGSILEQVRIPFEIHLHPNVPIDVKLPFPLSTVDYLASLLPHNISRNPHEVTRFKDFIAAKNLITDEIVNQIFTMKHDQVAEDVNLQEADANWGPDSYFCSVCVQPVISPNIFSWYMKARQQSIEANEGEINLSFLYPPLKDNVLQTSS